MVWAAAGPLLAWAEVLTLDELSLANNSVVTVVAGAPPATAGLPVLMPVSGCGASLSERPCWANPPTLVAPNGDAIHLDDDLPGPVWPMAVNLDAPVPQEALVFSIGPMADESPDGKTPNAGKPTKPDELQADAAESSPDSWDYELLILLGLGVLAIAASRLRKRRRGSRATQRVRKRVRLGARL